METVLTSTLSTEGRVSLPAPIRARLGLVAGDRVQFVLSDDGSIRVTTAQRLAEEVWAANTGGDAFDAAKSVRSVRMQEETDVAQASVEFDTSSPGGDALVDELFPNGDQ